MINKVMELKLKVRNKGYSGEISRKLLKELVSLNGRIGFRGYTKNDIVERSNGVLTYSPTNIVNNKIVNYKNDTYISQDKYKESPEIMVKNNDILFVKTGSTLGKSALVRNLTEPATINPQLIVIRTIHVDSDYLAVYLLTDSIQKQVFQVKIGGAVPTLTETEIGKFVVKLPPLPEQTAIGSLFRTLDDLLTSYKENLANYQSLKATMLSKMFPKAGQTVPEIRLDGFESGWEEKEFSKLVKRVTQSSDSDSLPKVEFEDIISGQGRLNKDISSKFDNRKGIHFKPGYTLYGKLRPYLNNWLLPKFEGVALGDFWVFDPNGNDSNFIYYLVQSSRYQKVANDTSGTKMPRSDWKSVSSTIFAIPQIIAEQQAIGTYFSNLDCLIAAYQEKISQLETLKKKFLQDMFI